MLDYSRQSQSCVSVGGQRPLLQIVSRRAIVNPKRPRELTGKVSAAAVRQGKLVTEDIVRSVVFLRLY